MPRILHVIGYTQIVRYSLFPGTKKVWLVRCVAFYSNKIWEIWCVKDCLDLTPSILLKASFKTHHCFDKKTIKQSDMWWQVIPGNRQALIWRVCLDFKLHYHIIKILKPSKLSNERACLPSFAPDWEEGKFGFLWLALTFRIQTESATLLFCIGRSMLNHDARRCFWS